ncbi:MAG: hypothetical protein KF875_06075 [Trueperaceae bacterium]|nr:hypothetical protein [Trueperaceae bacterium]
MADAPGAYLGLDAGGSSTRWLLVGESGDELARGSGGPISAIQLRTDEREAALERLAALLAEVGSTARPVRVVAGVTGLEPGSPDALTLAMTAARALALPEPAVRVMPDIHVAYLSAFAPGSGVLVYAGTGSIAFHLSAGGVGTRAGGHGYLIDDAGGGFWIGREALKRVLRRADEQGAPAGGTLAGGLYAALGGSDWDAIRRAVYAGGRARVAALTRVVALAAARGDDDARAVLAAAGAELARLARVVSGRLGVALPVVLAGGVARCGAPLTSAMEEALPSGTRFSVSTREPVEAAAALAREQAGLSG